MTAGAAAHAAQSPLPLATTSGTLGDIAPLTTTMRVLPPSPAVVRWARPAHRGDADAAESCFGASTSIRAASATHLLSAASATERSATPHRGRARAATCASSLPTSARALHSLSHRHLMLWRHQSRNARKASITLAIPFSSETALSERVLRHESSHQAAVTPNRRTGAVRRFRRASPSARRERPGAARR